MLRVRVLSGGAENTGNAPCTDETAGGTSGPSVGRFDNVTGILPRMCVCVCLNTFRILIARE